MMYENGDRYPICGSGTIKVERKPEIFEYKGQSLTLELTVYSCNVFGGEFFDNEEMKKHQKTIKDFQRRVDGLLTSEKIKQIREKIWSFPARACPYSLVLLKKYC
ncbi:MAG: DNA-binding transcriptional regulator YiaG [Thermodesulfobacteria bacterium]|nr:DNA-binding transcriptional regulator YiaG [Thermodesulfobacteriota bacterium]